MIPYGRQSISEEDIKSVEAVLRSDFLTQGPVVPAFEQALALRVGASFATAVNSATSALHIACLALGVGHGDEVWTSANSFVASSNCALYCGATVDFVDIDPETLCMSPCALGIKLQERRDGGLPPPKVVIPVHFGGQSCDMASIQKLSIEFGFRVIEDASHAIGAEHEGRPVGSCHFSDMAVFSFHPVKIVTTAEGGAILTQNAELHSRVQRLRTHGITRETKLMEEVDPDPWYYEQKDLGLNYRMTELQAALGLSQMSRLDGFVARRRELAADYDLALVGRCGTQTVPSFTKSARHLYPIRVPKNLRKEIFESLRHAGIGVNVHYIPIYWHPFYRAMGFTRGMCPEAERYYAEAISLPLYADLTVSDQSYVIDKVKKCIPV